MNSVLKNLLLCAVVAAGIELSTLENALGENLASPALEGSSSVVSLDSAVCEIPLASSTGTEDDIAGMLFFFTTTQQSTEVVTQEPGDEKPEEEKKIYVNRCPTQYPYSAEASAEYSYRVGSNGGDAIEAAIRTARNAAKAQLPKECPFRSGDDCRICDDDVNVEGKCTRQAKFGATDYEDTINETDDGEESGTVQGTVTSQAKKRCEYKCQ